jgi:hypothetical protein
VRDALGVRVATRVGTELVCRRAHARDRIDEGLAARRVCKRWQLCERGAFVERGERIDAAVAVAVSRVSIAVAAQLDTQPVAVRLGLAPDKFGAAGLLIAGLADWRAAVRDEIAVAAPAVGAGFPVSISALRLGATAIAVAVAVAIAGFSVRVGRVSEIRRCNPLTSKESKQEDGQGAAHGPMVA